MLAKMEDWFFEKVGVKNTINKKWQVGKRKIRFEWQRKNARGWSRFGGGWDMELGIQIGGSSIIINMLVCSIRIDKEVK
jgi:hypothetical protein